VTQGLVVDRIHRKAPIATPETPVPLKKNLKKSRARASKKIGAKKPHTERTEGEKKGRPP